MKNKSWITGLLIIILTGVAVAARIFYVNSLMEAAAINGDLYNTAKVGAGAAGLSAFFADGFSLEALYACTLSAAFLIFGNFAVAGVYLNILYQVFTVLLIFAFVKNVSGRYAGFGAGLIAALIPVYISRLSEVTVLNMEIFLAAALCAAAGFAARRIVQRHAGRKSAGSEASVSPETKPLRDTSVTKNEPDDLDEQKINYIENPLPVPKRRKHKAMDFALEPDADDDFDIKDMTGRDFYDIE